IILPACKKAKSLLKPGNLEEVAEAIMTTDTIKKFLSEILKRNQDKEQFTESQKAPV
ncbi:bifunctional ornithine acetyltransferase/N-acetylglutamate synthase domain protein, partial [Leptospira interrogans str. 2002000626]